ncbi:carboxymuconolactone decarboxylase family protein [Neobacillus sp. NPDC093182]|uniref:carboxymuconolactone decarboxylase family protein n=1 Tax=Neobacillus sp. NPDC093182 TaxID=3364297 RepID=UPI0037F1FAD5
MTERINYMKESPEFFKKIMELSMQEKKSSIEESTLQLVHIKASQMNGCGFCLDMHLKEAKIHGCFQNGTRIS